MCNIICRACHTGIHEYTHTRTHVQLSRTISGAPRTTAHSPTVCGTDDVASIDESSAWARALAAAAVAAAADDDDEVGIDEDEIAVDVECAVDLAVASAAECLSPCSAAVAIERLTQKSAVGSI